MAKGDKIPGGLTDNWTVEGVAKKHDVSVDKINKELKKGIDIELEHTNSKDEAREIALDHLYEFPDYYTRLDKMEKDAEKEMKNEGITEYARRMRELAGLSEGTEHKSLNTIQEGASSFEEGATFMAKDLMGESEEDLENPEKADLDKDGELSDYEKKRGKAVEKNMKKESINESEEAESEFEVHEFEQKTIEEGENDEELYTLNENTIIVLDFLDDEETE